MNDTLRQEAMQEFEKSTHDWGLDYERDGLSYTDYATGVNFGAFLLGYEACYIKHGEK